MPNLTPGDWMRGNCESYDGEGKPFRNVWSEEGPDAELICRCFGDDCDDNAQLLSAAKDLLEACNAVLDEHNKSMEAISAENDLSGCNLTCRTISRLHRAIKKAEGKSQRKPF